MRRFCPLASGSKGNCLYLETREKKILIDAGLSARMTEQKLCEIGVSLSEIDAIIVTHEHIDHIRAIPILGAKKKIPIFANRATAKAIYDMTGSSPPFTLFSTGEAFEFGDITFDPFTIQHDAIDPVGFAIWAEGVKLGVCADLGFATPLVVNKLQGCRFLYLEANHQVEMVHSSQRPAIYKQRVLGRLGHLSNDQSAALLKAVLHSGLEHVYLAHLSSECNSPEVALRVVYQMLHEEGANTTLSIAHQETISQQMGQVAPI